MLEKRIGAAINFREFPVAPRLNGSQRGGKPTCSLLGFFFCYGGLLWLFIRGGCFSLGRMFRLCFRNASFFLWFFSAHGTVIGTTSTGSVGTCSASTLTMCHAAHRKQCDDTDAGQESLKFFRIHLLPPPFFELTISTAKATIKPGMA